MVDVLSVSSVLQECGRVRAGIWYDRGILCQNYDCVVLEKKFLKPQMHANRNYSAFF